MIDPKLSKEVLKLSRRRKRTFRYRGVCGNYKKRIGTNKAEFKGGYTGTSFGFYTTCPKCGWETEVQTWCG